VLRPSLPFAVGVWVFCCGPCLLTVGVLAGWCGLLSAVGAALSLLLWGNCGAALFCCDLAEWCGPFLLWGDCCCGLLSAVGWLIVVALFSAVG
jgi:hypothetical protein